MSDKIKEYFSNDEYKVRFGHTMPVRGYKYIEDYEDDISQVLFVALFKLFMFESKNKKHTLYNTFHALNHYFEPEFGYYDEDEEFEDFIESLTDNDIKLTKEEDGLLKEFFCKLIDDIVDFEDNECPVEARDSEIEDAIKNKTFVIVISTSSDY